MSRQIKLGGIAIGGGAPVAVQSMTNTDTRNADATLAQLERLSGAGCEIARLAVPDEAAASVLPRLVAQSPLPLIADIHFDYRLAVRSADAGMAGIRINPGNLGSIKNLDAVVDAARANGCVIRIGVNSGSLEKDLLEKYGHPTPEAMAQSALRHVRHLENRNFSDLKISLKSSSVKDTVAAYRRMRQLCGYPLHIGVTEAGSLLRGAVKSAVGLGILLAEGIGDTLRVSLTAPPEDEVGVAFEILRALGLRALGPEIISCPTCGRTEINLFRLASEVEKKLAGSRANIKVAVMGCVVNGPGEAREADIGLAGGRGRGVIFRKGQVVRSVDGEDALLAAFMEEMEKLLTEKQAGGGRKDCRAL